MGKKVYFWHSTGLALTVRSGGNFVGLAITKFAIPVLFHTNDLSFSIYATKPEDSAKTLEKPSMRGIKKSVVEKYSDQAHFIYELLQNANDAKATKSSFQLTTEGLYFRHNGKVLFTVSNPDMEDDDKENNTLGHINSITAIANSNKTESSIGKFGVGFKAVFQYTETPHIYDPNFQFKIDRFIIPVKLENDLINRQKDITVFYFPFNKKEISPEKAHSDILDKLKRLVYPTLFLSSLQEVVWDAENEGGNYIKKIIEQKQSNNNSYQRLELCQKIEGRQTIEYLLLFTRNSEKQNQNCSIGYFLEEGVLKPKTYTAFCFFPTKVTTNLNFIIHAPFLLTDSREGIKEFEDHNVLMIRELAKLSADSLVILKGLKLIDDNLFNIIPYQKDNFYEKVWDEDKCVDIDKPKFLAPVFELIKKKLQTNELLPSNDGTYVKKENAYWADSPDLANLFSNEQLAELVKNQSAKWVFATIGRTKDPEITNYIDRGSERNWVRKESNLIKSNIDFENKIANLITSNFIKKQSNEWLHKFYSYLSERKSYQDKFKTKPIFKDRYGNAVPAFEQKGNELHGILFLPLEETISAYKTIDPELLKNEKTKEFIKNFDIKQASLKDEIYNKILPLYNTNEAIDTRPHFEIFFKYWKEEGRPEDFINLIKDKSFIIYKTNDNETKFRGEAGKVYYPTLDLETYFKTNANIKFVDLENYYTFITDKNELQTLKEFLLKLGVSEYPRILEREITDFDEKNTIKSTTGENLKSGTSGYRGQGTFDKIIEGCKEILKNIDIDKTFLLWNILGKLKLSSLTGVHKYFYYSQQYQFFESTTLTLLKKKKWLLSNRGEFVAPSEITISDLANGYKSNVELEHLLEFKPTVILSDAERIAQKFESIEEAELARRLLEKHKARQSSSRLLDDNSNDFDEEENPKLPQISRTIKNLEELQNEFPTKHKGNQSYDSQNKPEINFNEDEEFAKGIEELKKQLEIKKSRVDLAESINNSVKYSYGWFKAYLQLLKTYDEKQEAQKQKSISFQKIKPYKADNKYFLLYGASNYISPEIENADDFKVSLVFENGKRENITVEGVSKKGQDLLIYCRERLSNNTLLRLPNVFKVEINFTPVIDLLDRLYKVFTNNNYIDEWDNIQNALPSLNFIYGPPGTGKTTTLCNRIKDIIIKNPNAKILVLTPTNKAADVVCKKLWNIDSDIIAIRLSNPTDPDLEEEAIYQDTLNDGDIEDINVVASTIHRLPYFDIKGIGLMFQYDWDYVIFDESSMTGLHYITFAIMALFKTNPNTNFIIAGDPKQIPPVVEIGEKELEKFDFQDENIYKMMNLESFNPKEQEINKREIDTIQNLDKQYRSVPIIGQLFSELSYSSLLKHDRETNRKEAKILPEKFRELISSNVTFVDIQLNQDNSIYRVNKLFYSSYHTYSAILVSEIIKYFDTTNKEEQWTIGLIAPYEAQAILLNKLITSYGIPENIKVISDTVHGFQGDECDIVFFVCNPNNYYYSGHKKALLSKEYIYNVAISRAKDFLIVLHPYSAIPNNNFINKIGHSYENNFGNTKILNANDIENILFNDRSYIASNSYVSGHDSVNIFGLSKMKYFIKANDTAIDIQLRD